MDRLQLPPCPTSNEPKERDATECTLTCHDWGARDQQAVLPAGEIIREPSASGLAYLFANEFVPPIMNRAMRDGVNVPCREDINPPQQALAILLFAAAFWSLREQGYIILEIDKRMRVRVDFTGRDWAGHRGLEATLFANLTTMGRMHAASAIYNCWKEDKVNPWNDVVAAAANEVSSMSQDCGKLGPLARAFDDFKGRWQRFQASEPVLYKALIDECTRGIAARRQGQPVRKGTDGGAGEALVLAIGAGLAMGAAGATNSSDGSSGGFLDNFVDGVSDFFDGVSDFLNGVGDFFDGMGDFFCGDSGGDFDFD